MVRSSAEPGERRSPEIHEIFRTVKEPEVCPYLRDRLSRTELRLVASIEDHKYAEILAEGYRRFGMVFFRPACEGCSACIPIRIPVDRFRPTKSQRRVLRKNQGVTVEVGEPLVDEERLELHRAFHRERSERVGWDSHKITPDDYAAIFLQNVVPTMELRYRIGGRLVAVAYVDLSPESLNSIYCFHHPQFSRHSLGTFDVLVEIGLARRLARRYLYLGYYIEQCRSMAYKAAFHPSEIRIDDAWREMPPRNSSSGA